MNPFLESTLALPHAEPWRTAQREQAFTEAQACVMGHSAACRTVKKVVPPPAVRPACAQRSVWAALVAGLSCLAAPAVVMAIDVNAASALQLEAVQGIGPKTAQVIVHERERAGRYESLQDLSDRVKGIGPKKITRLAAAGLTVGGAMVQMTSSDTVPRASSAGTPAAAVPAPNHQADGMRSEAETVQERLKGYFRR